MLNGWNIDWWCFEKINRINRIRVNRLMQRVPQTSGLKFFQDCLVSTNEYACGTSSCACEIFAEGFYFVSFYYENRNDVNIGILFSFLFFFFFIATPFIPICTITHKMPIDYKITKRVKRNPSLSFDLSFSSKRKMLFKTFIFNFKLVFARSIRNFRRGYFAESCFHESFWPSSRIRASCLFDSRKIFSPHLYRVSYL